MKIADKSVFFNGVLYKPGDKLNDIDTPKEDDKLNDIDTPKEDDKPRRRGRPPKGNQ